MFLLKKKLLRHKYNIHKAVFCNILRCFLMDAAICEIFMSYNNSYILNNFVDK
jgi:hypothetical protein